MSRYFLCFLVSLIALRAQPPARGRSGPPPGPVDGVRIVEVLPSKLIVGEEQEVFVRVRYDLKNRETAELQLGFNTKSPSGFGVFAREPVSKGEGEIVLSARVTPRDWGKLVFFQAFVALSDPIPPRAPDSARPPSPPETPSPPLRRPLAVDHAPLELAVKKE